MARAQKLSGVQAFTARAPMAVSLLLGLAIAVEAADVALSLATESSVASGNGAAATATHRRREPGSALTAIAAAHLFGLAPPRMSAANLRAAGRAPLILTGIIATGDPHDGFAIVGTSPTKTHAVYAGSEAAPGTILAEVYPQEVVLQRGAERLTLRLPRTDLPGERAAGSVLPRERPNRAARDDGGGDSEDAEFAAQHTLAERLTDSAAVVNSFALQQTSVDGMRGAMITDTGINSKVLRALGLEPGDLIVRVNGAQVGAVDISTLMNALQDGGATLVVDRRGESLPIAIDQYSLADAAALFRKADPNL